MRRAVALLVAVPACTRLLTVAAHLEQPVGDRQLAVVRVGGGAALAAGMADVETSEVADGERPHRVAEIDHHLVDLLRQAALLQRSEERRVGKGWLSTFRSGWSAYH